MILESGNVNLFVYAQMIYSDLARFETPLCSIDTGFFFFFTTIIVGAATALADAAAVLLDGAPKPIVAPASPSPSPAPPRKPAQDSNDCPPPIYRTPPEYRVESPESGSSRRSRRRCRWRVGHLPVECGSGRDLGAFPFVARRCMRGLRNRS